MAEKSRTPPAIGRLEATLNIIEEIDTRLKRIKEALSATGTNAKQIDGSSIRDLFNAVEEIGRAIDDTELHIDVLETRISTIESLRNRQG